MVPHSDEEPTPNFLYEGTNTHACSQTASKRAVSRQRGLALPMSTVCQKILLVVAQNGNIL